MATKTIPTPRSKRYYDQWTKVSHKVAKFISLIIQNLTMDQNIPNKLDLPGRNHQDGNLRTHKWSRRSTQGVAMSSLLNLCTKVPSSSFQDQKIPKWVKNFNGRLGFCDNLENTLSTAVSINDKTKKCNKDNLVTTQYFSIYSIFRP